MSTTQTPLHSPPDAAPKHAAPVAGDPHVAAAKAIVASNARWAAGVGLIPLPLVDWAAISGIQTRMLRQLCAEYKVPYDKASASRYIGALVGGFVPASFGYSLASILKTVPIVGTAAFIAVPAVAYATTSALGEVFIPHFESGGNLYTFDPAAQTALFAYYYNRGKMAAEAAV